MRLLALIVVAACGPVPAQRVERPRPVERQCGPSAPAPRNDIARIVSELGRVDEELDRIDQALIAADDSGPTTLAEARLLVERKRQLPRETEIRLRDDDPFLVRRAAIAYLQARRDLGELEQYLGPRHVELVRAKQRVVTLEKHYAAQRDAEIAFAVAWSEALKKLPAAATARDIRSSRVRALATMKDVTLRGIVPSDAPAALIAAALRVGDLQSRRDELALDVGPKHPELVSVRSRLADAQQLLETAFTEAQRLADAGSPPGIDPAMIARRAALAKEAQLLRRELAAQLAR